MDFQLINPTGATASVKIEFFDSDGVEILVPMTFDGSSFVTQNFSLNLSARGIQFMRTDLDTASAQIGYAVISSDPPDAGVVQPGR
jgi:hypothetical protein